VLSYEVIYKKNNIHTFFGTKNGMYKKYLLHLHDSFQV